MKKVLKSFGILLLLFTLSACVSTDDIKVKSEKSNKVDLTGYKTYSILKTSGIDEQYQNKMMKNTSNNIKKMITNELLKKDKTAVSSNPDFYVAYAIGINMKKSLNCKLDKETENSVKELPEAAIVLMFVDAKTGKKIWLSTAEGDVKGLPEKEKQERIQFAIKKMLSNL